MPFSTRPRVLSLFSRPKAPGMLHRRLCFRCSCRDRAQTTSTRSRSSKLKSRSWSIQRVSVDLHGSRYTGICVDCDFERSMYLHRGELFSLWKFGCSSHALIISCRAILLNRIIFRCRNCSQPLSRVSRKQRYNTLDFASKIVCQQECSRPYWKPSVKEDSPL